MRSEVRVELVLDRVTNVMEKENPMLMTTAIKALPLNFDNKKV